MDSQVHIQKVENVNRFVYHKNLNTKLIEGLKSCFTAVNE